MDRTGFASIEEAVEDIRNGKMIIAVDNENRENEGDLITAGQTVSPEQLNFMASYAKGLICMPVSAAIAGRLQLDPMTSHNTDNHCTAFTVSVDAIETTTGISAFDRCSTARRLAAPDSAITDFRRPGHLFPLVAVTDGVLRRRGHTEATVDLCRLAGLPEAGLCCEIMSGDGHMSRLPEIMSFAKQWGVKLITIDELAAYRKVHEKIVELRAEALLPTKYGTFRILAFVNRITGTEHAALVMGDVSASKNILCRVHSACITGDTFGSLKCDCGQQLDAALRMIADEKCGVLVYLAQEGRGIGFVNKIRAYSLQDKGFDTVDANLKLGLPEDARDYTDCIQIFNIIGINRIRLLTNNPRKIEGLGFEGSGITVTERVPLEMIPQQYDCRYLTTKRTRMGHLLVKV
jgi:3,4-dihydroxy 2-butanone 4-phosphate synthase / GTP cyclohydrolase II